MRGFLHTVKFRTEILRVIFFQIPYYRTELIKIALIRCPCAVNNVLVKMIFIGKARNHHLKAHGTDEKNRRSIPEPAFAVDVKHYQVDTDESHSNPDSVNITVPLVILFLNYYEQQSQYSANTDYIPIINASDFRNRSVRKNYHNKYKHKAVSVVEPVRSMKAMPYKVER